jgi:DNA-directed RNA polymerase subunit M/transcription elongation factor TFIIS
MATPSSATLPVSCPDCGARFQVGAELAGKKGRCAKCGSIFRVPAAARPVGGLSEADTASAKRTKSASETPPTKRKDESPPQHIRLYCRVCQTMMYGRPDEIGHKIKCPDCGAQNVVPQPEKLKAKSTPPPADDSDDLELWGVDEAPSVAEMVAAQPKFVSVECPTCQTLMQVPEKQAGQKIKCPDCFKVIVVPQPSAPKPARSVLSRDEDDILIDPTLDPGERAPVIIQPRRPMLYEEEAEAEQKRREEKLARGERVGTMYDRAGRPIMPRWPMATRILPFLFSRGVPVRWIIFSVGATIGLSIGLYGLSMAMTGGFAAIGGMSFVAMGIMIMAIWFGGFAATIFAIITESSEGTDRIEQWPTPVVTDWFGEAFTLLVALLMSPLPGWLIGRFIPDDGVRNSLFLGSFVVSLPIVLLSQLDLGSMFGIASPRVIASVLRLPASWLLFYFEIAVIVALCVGLALAAEVIPFLVLAFVPFCVAAAFLAARILGRLAWKLAESTSQAQIV